MCCSEVVLDARRANGASDFVEKRNVHAQVVIVRVLEGAQNKLGQEANAYFQATAGGELLGQLHFYLGHAMGQLRPCGRGRADQGHHRCDGVQAGREGVAYAECARQRPDSCDVTLLARLNDVRVMGQKYALEEALGHGPLTYVFLCLHIPREGINVVNGRH